MEHKDDDDDDDVTFAKWMSSFWGHSWMKEEERGLRDHHGSQDTSYRKASLPCPGPENRKEKNERECLRLEIRSSKKAEERRSSRKEEHGEAYAAPLFEKRPK
ncbi:leukemia NUP98 fusion partner 1 [Phyllostomus discolor]|uniref:Leukemia NUP98 fusion partner 1 n=1 Tax=Phyllostomus discolor TaxID=89673 RepID=A0A834AVX3_9CHIR|nr:leukemia NUP98 fusion partner 1 [Phyllostomus discolor]